MTRTQQRAAENRRTVIDAAREIIATQGVEALTLEAVAEKADVVVQTIYNRVGGRSALLTAVAEQALEQSRVYMDPAYEADGTVEERMMLAANAYARFARERPHEFRILVEPPNEPRLSHASPSSPVPRTHASLRCSAKAWPPVSFAQTSIPTTSPLHCGQPSTGYSHWPGVPGAFRKATKPSTAFLPRTSPR